MARSKYVYVVTLSSHPIAAFTVKHECVRWLGLQWPSVPTNLRVYRLRDGYAARLGREAQDITARLYGLAEET